MQKRRQEKKATLQAVKKFKKGRGDKPSFLGVDTEEDHFPVSAENFTPSGRKGEKGPAAKRDQRNGPSKKRALKVRTTISFTYSRVSEFRK
jgi:hypothetical protein